MTWKPHVTVASVVERDGKFLMVEETVDGKLLLNQPAGHLEPGESLIDAAVREAREETAWEIRPVSLVGLYQWQDPRLDDGIVRICFHAEPVRHLQDQALDDGIVRAVWMTPEQVSDGPVSERSPLVNRCIRDFRAGHRFDLDLLHALL